MQSAHSPSLYIYLYNRESSLLILYLVTSILYHESPFYCTVCSIQIYSSPYIPADGGTEGTGGSKSSDDACSSGGGDTIKRKAESKIQLFFQYLLYVYCITRLIKV